MNNDSDRLQGFNKIPQSPHESLTFSLCEIIEVLARWKDFNERRFRDAHVSVPPPFAVTVQRESGKLWPTDFSDEAERS